MTAKRNHYLPQFYLEKFIPKSSKTFWVYDKKTGESRPQTPINTGVEGHLYTVLNAKGEVDDSIETGILSPIDGEVKPIFDRWCSSPEEIRQTDIPTVAAFLAVFHMRVPRQIDVIQEYQRNRAIYFMKKIAADAVKLKEYGSSGFRVGRE